jgi:hypothetical protein
MIWRNSETMHARNLDFNKAAIFNSQVRVKSICIRAMNVVAGGVFDLMAPAEKDALTVLSVLANL